jgi:hypothetical protein
VDLILYLDEQERIGQTRDSNQKLSRKTVYETDVPDNRN